MTATLISPDPRTSLQLPNIQLPSIGFEVITPEEAKRLIDIQIEHDWLNRTVRPREINKMAEDIRRGLWVVNGETIIIAWDDRVIDGQHRLWSIREAQTAIISAVVRGIDPKVMSTIDTGMKRTGGDVLKLSGVQNAVVMSAGLNLLWRILNDGGGGWRPINRGGQGAIDQCVDIGAAGGTSEDGRFGDGDPAIEGDHVVDEGRHAALPVQSQRRHPGGCLFPSTGDWCRSARWASCADAAE